MIKHCSKCEIEISSNKRYCKECHAAYMRDWRKTHKIKQEQKLKNVIRSIMKYENIGKHACSKCGDSKIQAHYYDYSNPLEIIWLCQKHHEEMYTHMFPVKHSKK